jgi:Cys-rich protein (TIGR01571 family)
MEAKEDPNAPKGPVSEGTPLTAGSGKWRTQLCGCFEDCCICCSVCCCHPITVGQIYERAVTKGLLKRAPMMMCLSIAIFLFFCEAFQNAVAGNGPLIYMYTISKAAYNSEPGWDDMYHWEYNYTSHEYQYHPTDESIEDAAAARADVNEDINQAMAGPVILITIGNLLGLASMCCMFFIVCTVRGAIRRREGIQPECCGECEDCCCAFFCSSCTQVCALPLSDDCVPPS